jgi:hypothetical protein
MWDLDNTTWLVSSIKLLNKRIRKSSRIYAAHMKPKPSSKNAQCRMRAKQILQGKKTNIAVAYATKSTVHAINQYNTVHKQKHAAANKQRTKLNNAVNTQQKHMNRIMQYRNRNKHSRNRKITQCRVVIMHKLNCRNTETLTQQLTRSRWE